MYIGKPESRKHRGKVMDTENITENAALEHQLISIPIEIAPSNDNHLIYLLRYFSSVIDQDSENGYLFSPSAETIQHLREECGVLLQYQTLSGIFVHQFEQTVSAWKSYISSAMKKGRILVSERYLYVKLRNSLWSHFLGGSLMRQPNDNIHRKATVIKKSLLSNDYRGISNFFCFSRGHPCLVLFKEKSNDILKTMRYNILEDVKELPSHKEYFEILDDCLNSQITKDWLNWLRDLLDKHPDSFFLQRIKLITLIWMIEHKGVHDVVAPIRLSRPERLHMLSSCRLNAICTTSEFSDLDDNEQYFHQIYLKYCETNSSMMVLNFDQIILATLSYTAHIIENTKGSKSSNKDELSRMLNDALQIYPQGIHSSLSIGFATTEECLNIGIENMGTTFRWSPIELRFVCLISMGCGIWSNKRTYDVKKLIDFEDDNINDIIKSKDEKEYFVASHHNKQIVSDEEHEQFIREETKKLEELNVQEQEVQAFVKVKDQIYHERDNDGNIVLADETKDRKRRSFQMAQSEASVSVAGFKRPNVKARKTVGRLLEKRRCGHEMEDLVEDEETCTETPKEDEKIDIQDPPDHRKRDRVDMIKKAMNMSGINDNNSQDNVATAERVDNDLKQNDLLGVDIDPSELQGERKDDIPIERPSSELPAELDKMKVELKSKYEKINGRKEFFSNAYQHLIKYKDDYDILIEVSKIISSYMTNVELPSEYFAQREHQLPSVHNYSLSIYSKTNAPLGTVPCYVEEDGNSLFRSFSVLIFGDDCHHMEMRVRSYLEILLNPDHYVSAKVMKVVVNGKEEDYTQFILLSQAKQDSKMEIRKEHPRLVFDVISEDIFLDNDVGFWHIASMSKILNVSVLSLYPNFTDKHLYAFDRILHPDKMSNKNDQLPTSAIYLMWTRSEDGVGEWHPTHFVPCLKAKRYYDEDSDIRSPNNTQKSSPVLKYVNKSTPTKRCHKEEGVEGVVGLMENNKRKRLFEGEEKLDEEIGMNQDYYDESPFGTNRNSMDGVTKLEVKTNSQTGDSFLEISTFNGCGHNDSYSDSLKSQSTLRTAIQTHGDLNTAELEKGKLDEAGEEEEEEEEEGKRERMHSFLYDVSMRKEMSDLSEKLEKSDAVNKKKEEEIRNLKSQITKSVMDNTNKEDIDDKSDGQVKRAIDELNEYLKKSAHIQDLSESCFEEEDIKGLKPDLEKSERLRETKEIQWKKESEELRKQLGDGDTSRSLEEMQDLLQRTSDERNQLKEEMEQMKKTIVEKNDRLNTMQNMLDETKEKQYNLFNEQKEKMENVHRELSNFEQIFAEKDQQISDANGQANERDLVISDLKEGMRTSETRYQEKLHELELMQRELHGLRLALTEREGEMGEVEKNVIIQQTNQINALNKRILEDSIERDQYNLRIDEINNCLNQQKHEKETIKNDYGNRISELNKILEETTRKSTVSNEKLIGTEREIDDLKDNIAIALDEKQRIEKENGILQRELNREKHNNKLLNETIGNKTQESIRLENEKELSVREQDLLQRENPKLRSQLTQTGDSLKKNKTDLGELEHKYKIIELQLTRTEEEKNGIENNLQKSQDANKMMESNMGKLETEKSELLDKVQQLELLLKTAKGIENNLQKSQDAQKMMESNMGKLGREKSELLVKVQQLELLLKTAKGNVSQTTHQRGAPQSKRQFAEENSAVGKSAANNDRQQTRVQIYGLPKLNDQLEPKNVALDTDIEKINSKLEEQGGEHELEMDRPKERNGHMRENTRKSSEAAHKNITGALDMETVSNETTNGLMRQIKDLKDQIEKRANNSVELENSITQKDVEISVLHKKIRDQIDEKERHLSFKKKDLNDLNIDLTNKCQELEDKIKRIDEDKRRISDENEQMKCSQEETECENESLKIKLDEVERQTIELEEKESQTRSGMRMVMDDMQKQLEEIYSLMKHTDKINEKSRFVRDNRQKILDIGGETLLSFIEDVYVMLKKECLEMLRSMKNVGAANAVYKLMESFIDKLENEIVNLTHAQMLLLEKKKKDRQLQEANGKLYSQLTDTLKSVRSKEDSCKSLQEENERCSHEIASLRTRLDTTESKEISLSEQNKEIQDLLDCKEEEFLRLRKKHEDEKIRAHSEVKASRDELQKKRRELSETNLKRQLREKEISELQRKIKDYNMKFAKQNVIISHLRNDSVYEDIQEEFSGLNIQGEYINDLCLICLAKCQMYLTLILLLLLMMLK